ncbi:hypothetical protein HRW23_32580 [Streptomyces lunaelactis]|uniref:hypothetical protein n=1 Tax=Streptomyces lunaelactis TaxID=1535768 RepID=UPI0015855BDF|nr:hypothetical protein [Streptomyces lunaelactis]NUK11281.1 hypothetical protein [Streptomyces lunaelactis]NUK19784.1 hypothetical protein [Streptomyces lunaelactis]NUK25141.1 hypothetical protein [Streptomyces lunaelactis]NUK36754.1 hypothetical protein [Streptomyces lunaelactis]
MKKMAAGASTVAACTAFITALGIGTASAAPQSFSESSAAHGYTNGSIEFYNRSVLITGTVKSNTTGCVRVAFTIPNPTPAPDVYETRTACGRGTGTSKGFEFTAPADFPGGAAWVKVQLGIVGDNGLVSDWVDGDIYYP